MIEFWKSLSGNARFSVIAFFSCGALGLVSMGLLGAVLYYPVSFVLRKFPTLNDWTGDWVWPAMIGVGMFWSLGFLFGGVVWHSWQKLHLKIYFVWGVYTCALAMGCRDLVHRPNQSGLQVNFQTSSNMTRFQ